MAATGAVELLTATAAAMAGLHPFVSIGLLLAVTVAVLMRLGGNATVRLTDAGIERTVTPLMARVVAWPDRHQHRRRPSFYQSVAAKVLTLVFSVAALVVAAFAVNRSLSPQNLFRLWASSSRAPCI